MERKEQEKTEKCSRDQWTVSVVPQIVDEQIIAGSKPTEETDEDLSEWEKQTNQEKARREKATEKEKV